MVEKEKSGHNQQALQNNAVEKLIKKLWKEIRTLPKDCREVTVLFCFDSCTPEEISEVLCIPVSIVRRRLQIAQQHLSIDLYSAVKQLRALNIPTDFVQRVMEAIRDKTPMPTGNI